MKRDKKRVMSLDGELTTPLEAFNTYLKRNYTVAKFYCNCFYGCLWASREFCLIK